MTREFITPVSVTTSGSGWTQAIAPTRQSVMIIFENSGTVAFDVSFSVDDGGNRVKAFRVPGGASYTPPCEVDLSYGIFVKRIGATDVSNAEISGQIIWER